ncbi:MAG: hypothetical protein J6Z50_04795 [Fibrobacterales bacterium]|nr:hypothetical protein [Fibrobacterales bacterium]
MRFGKLLPALLLCALAAARAEGERASGWDWDLGLEVHPSTGSDPRGKGIVDTADRFGPNWWALRADVRSWRAWTRQPDFLAGTADLAWGARPGEPGFGLRLRSKVGLRRDYEAWIADDAAHNLPLGANEVDINVPYEGFAEAQFGPAELRVGRFEQRTGPSPSRGVTLSGAPWLDAARFSFDFTPDRPRDAGHVRYTLFVSSLDPWLEGTPGITDTLGSEAQRQRETAPVDNQRGRIYDQSVKTYAFHRLDLAFGIVRIGLQENAMVGGKDPDLRDLTPFGVWHNNYNDGMDNAHTTADLLLDLPFVGELYGEYVADDVNEDGATQPTVSAWMVGWHKAWNAGANGFSARAEWISVDPLYGRFALPLLELTDRRRWRSNHRDRNSKTYADTGFVDTWVVDAPMGYWRGPDVVDLWFDFAWTRGRWAVEGTVGWLRTGAWNARPEYDWRNAPESPLEGKERRELWLQADVVRRLVRPDVRLRVGFSWTEVLEKGEIGQPVSDGFGLSADLAWRISFRKPR